MCNNLRFTLMAVHLSALAALITGCAQEVNEIPDQSPRADGPDATLNEKEIVEESATTPLPKFEAYVKRLSSSLPEVFPIILNSDTLGRPSLNNFALRWPDPSGSVSYDVQTTDSLVSPYVGLVTFNVGINGKYGKFDMNSVASYEARYAYQKDKWVYKGVRLKTLDYLIDYPDGYDEHLKQLERDLIASEVEGAMVKKDDRFRIPIGE